jgi:CBS domain-containing protein
MKVSDILRIKGGTLFTTSPDELLIDALGQMDERDIGSLVVMADGALAGVLTVRELTQVLVKNGGDITKTLVRVAMDDRPMTCAMDTDIDEVRRMMLESHARYLPVMNQKVLMGVISFHDVARAVVDGQSFENKMLKAYIQDMPGGEPLADGPRL